jgi:hypothetical protein
MELEKKFVGNLLGMKYIGIDPGKSTGLAIYDTETGQFDNVYSTTFWGAIAAIDVLIAHSMPGKYELAAVVELPTTKAVWHKKAKTPGAKDRTAVNVGSVVREAELIVDYLKGSGIKVITQHPRGKVDAAYFKRVTGWQGVTNSHSRDAAMMCFGMRGK